MQKSEQGGLCWGQKGGVYGIGHNWEWLCIAPGKESSELPCHKVWGHLVVLDWLRVQIPIHKSSPSVDQQSLIRVCLEW